MKFAHLGSCVFAIAIVETLGVAGPAFAQQAAATEPKEELEIVVVTAPGSYRTRINSSESEQMRMIPLVSFAGTAGPGGNSNIAVRGLPVATGGSPFVRRHSIWQ